MEEKGEYGKLMADYIVDIRTEFSHWYQNNELGDNRVCLTKSGKITCRGPCAWDQQRSN